MHITECTFEKVFDIVQNKNQSVFSFLSNGRKHYSVTVAGCPRIYDGMTVLAALERPDAWHRGVIGWIDCSTGELVCESPRHYIVNYMVFFTSIIRLLNIGYRPWHFLFVLVAIAAITTQSLRKLFLARSVGRALTNAYSARPKSAPQSSPPSEL
jgi:hypothetical protein